MVLPPPLASPGYTDDRSDFAAQALSFSSTATFSRKIGFLEAFKGLPGTGKAEF
jgi:hypothetical protein